MLATERNHNGRWRERRAASVARLAVFVAGLGTLSCGSVGAVGGGNRTAVLVIDSEPEHVDVYVDGTYWGNTELAPDGAVPVPIEARRLELRAPGFYPHRRDLELGSDRTYTLRVRLVRQLD